MEQQQKILTFWDHLEELRHVLFRIAVAVVFLMLVAFLFKDELFAIVLAPKNADFIIYRFFCRIADFMAMPSLCPEVFYVKMINTQLAAQFITHMSVSFYAGFLLASPYVIYQLFRFVSPAPSYFPFSCYLSGQYGSGEHDYFVLVYGYVDDDESDDGDCFRDPCPLLAFCQTGISYG